MQQNEAKAAKSGMWWNLKSTQGKIDPEFSWRLVYLPPAQKGPQGLTSKHTGGTACVSCILLREAHGSWRAVTEDTASPGSRSPGLLVGLSLLPLWIRVFSSIRNGGMGWVYVYRQIWAQTGGHVKLSQTSQCFIHIFWSIQRTPKSRGDQKSPQL